MTFDRAALIDAAIQASDKAYVPYSAYSVGAALLSIDGVIYTGCNVENAAYPATLCAERTAVVKAVSEGAQQFAAIVIATRNGGSPCGTCRQVLNEFSPDMQVLCVTFDGVITIDKSLRELLPDGFGPMNLAE